MLQALSTTVGAECLCDVWSGFWAGGMPPRHMSLLTFQSLSIVCCRKDTGVSEVISSFGSAVSETG